MTEEKKEVSIWPISCEINFFKSYKCLNKSAPIKKETVVHHLHILYESLEEIRQNIFKKLNDLDISEQDLGNKKFLDLKNRLTKILLKYNFKEEDTLTIEKPIIYNLEKQEHNIESIENSQTTLNMAQTSSEFLGLASKLLPEFDGKPENLQSFINAINLVKSIQGEHESLGVLLIKTKIKGTVQNIIANEKTIDAIIEKLKNSIRKESVESIIAKLSHTQQNTKSATEFAKEVEDLTHALENSYVSDGLTMDLASRYATETAVKALIKGANNERAKIIMEAGQFLNINSAVTKFVNCSVNTNTENNVFYYGNKQNWNQYYDRSRGQNFYRSRGYRRGGRYNRGRGRGQFTNRESVQENQYYPASTTNRHSQRNIRIITDEESKNLEIPLDETQQD